jgi:hypothetical protein
VSVLGCDYAWEHPNPAALAAAGYKFACRYVSHFSTKNMSPGEVAALAAHGISTVSNFEDAAQTMLGGYNVGVGSAILARQEATACGMPAGRPVYFSADWDTTPDDQVKINAFLDGAASVLGRASVGIYGGYWTVKRALDGGHAAWAWQTLAWSGGQWDVRANIRQTGRQPTIGGVQVDENVAMTADYGQWTPGHSPDPPQPKPLENDMPYLISVTPDPSNPANKGAGIYAVDGGTPTHIPDSETYVNMTAKFGAAVVVTLDYYKNLLAGQEALAGTLAVTGSLSVAPKA